MEQKAVNPKDVVGRTKLSMSLVPDSMVVYAALSFTEGAIKYGPYNWRETDVSASVYMDAAKRHMAKWFNGEEFDVDTKVPHLASAMACLAIIVDAREVGTLVDDRPPKAGTSLLIDSQVPLIKHLKQLFEK